MPRRLVGVVSELWRYPVKSMLGESLEGVAAGEGGFEGDRAWALRSAETGNILSAKKWPGLLAFKARSTAAGEVLISVPGGTTVGANDPAASGVISDALGTSVGLERASEGVKSKADIDPATVFGEVPVEDAVPGFTRDTLPPVFKLPPGTFFDSAAVHVLASGTIGHMRTLCGPDAALDVRRFRPNIYVETTAAEDGFVEDAWLEGTLVVGESLRITSMRPALRCVMTTHPQSELPRVPGILRAVATHHSTNAGVFASIGSPGTVRRGDPVFLED